MFYIVFTVSHGLSDGYVVSRDRFDLGLVQRRLSSGSLPVFMAQDQHNEWEYRGCVSYCGNQYLAANHHWRLKLFCVSCRHPITILTISCQSRLDTESCDIFFILKLLIFDGAKWLQMWRWFPPKTQHRSTNKMAATSFILDRAVWSTYSLSFIF